MTIDVQKPVQEAIDRLAESGAERGVQVGAGGSFACADTSTGIAFAVTKNRLTNDFNTVIQVSQVVTHALAHG